MFAQLTGWALEPHTSVQVLLGLSQPINAT